MSESIIHIATRAARAAGDLIVRGLDRLDLVTISTKQPNDYVTDIDKASEKLIINIIQKAYPDHSILSEECGEIAGNEFQWIIDPLDGTRNFMHGISHFAVSIAVKHKQKIECGIVYDPIRQDLFTAVRGKGAQLNSRRIRVSTTIKLEEALLCTGFPFRDSKIHREAYLQALQTLIPVCGDLRRTGSAALDLAYVAAGRFDGFWEMCLHSWDIAAGILLVKEAGGLVTDLQGGESYLTDGNIIAATPKVFKPMLTMIKPLVEHALVSSH